MGQGDNWDYLTDFLKNNPDNFEDELSKAPYSVKVKRHPKRPNLVMFRYSQFESDFTNPVVRCCRGTVYDIRQAGGEKNENIIKPYLLPFFKFMNYGENGADPIDWSNTLYIREKLDGSLLKLLKEDDGNDLWTTNGSFDVNVDVPETIPAKNDENLPSPYTFAGLRNYALRGHIEEIKHLPKGWTFMFELTSPYNRIIVPYRETKLFLLGCRDPQGQEHTPEWAVKNFNLTFETPLVHSFKNIDEVLDYCHAVDNDGCEGFVIQDAFYNRVKIKTDHYRSLFYLKGEDHFSDTRLFMAIKQGSIDDAIVAWPEIKPRTEEITAEWIDFRNAVKALCKKAAAYYDDCKIETGDPKEAKKRYAIFIMDKYKAFSTFLFESVKDNADIEAIFNKIEYKELKSIWIPALESIE